MSAREQEMETLKQEGKKREAGVAELVELYKRIEPFYARAARRARPARKVFMSDSTNLKARAHRHATETKRELKSTNLLPLMG